MAQMQAETTANAAEATSKLDLEISRKLVTGSKFDVQFDDLKKGYGLNLLSSKGTLSSAGSQ